MVLCIALLWEGKQAYSLAYVFLLLFFLGYSWHNSGAKKIKLTRVQAEHRYFPRDKVEIGLQVQNNSNYPFPWISLREKVPHGLTGGGRPLSQVFSLPGKSSTEIRLELSPQQRGVYRLGPLELAAGDFFGLNTQGFSVQDFQIVIVYPQIYELADLLISTHLPVGNLHAQHKIYPDSTRLSGVRPYEQGDSLRTIHWPATARTQQLQVKQYEHTITANSLVFLNLNEEDYDRANLFSTSELAISTAASLSSSIIEAGEACGLVTNGTLTEHLPDQKVNLEHGNLLIQPKQGLAQLTELLTILAGLEPQTSSFLDLVRTTKQKLQPGTVLLWVVPKDTPELIIEAEKWTRLGVRVLIFVVGTKIVHPQLLHRPRGLVHLFAVRTEGGGFG